MLDSITKNSIHFAKVDQLIVDSIYSDSFIFLLIHLNLSILLHLRESAVLSVALGYTVFSL